MILALLEPISEQEFKQVKIMKTCESWLDIPEER
jgi:hypothetical protein